MQRERSEWSTARQNPPKMCRQRCPDVAGIAVEEAIRRLSAPTIKGSAFAISTNQFLTCNHVVSDVWGHPGTLKVVGGSSDPATEAPMFVHDIVSVQQDGNLDFALLASNSVQGEITPIALQTERPEVGMDILTVGYPLPEQASNINEQERRVAVNVSATFRATRGIVSSIMADGLHFEIDRQFNPGQSGGPIVSIETGLLVGICQAQRTYSIGGTLFPANMSLGLSLSSVNNRLMEWGLLRTF